MVGGVAMTGSAPARSSDSPTRTWTHSHAPTHPCRAAEEEMVGGITIMGERLGKEQPLVGAAFREHYR